MLLWTMVGSALWHIAVFVADRRLSGIVDGLLLALPLPGGVSRSYDAAPGVAPALWAMTGAFAAVGWSYWHGPRRVPRAGSE